MVGVIAAEIPSDADLASSSGMRSVIELQGFSLKLCSRIRGRERWHVRGLEGNKRLARAVEEELKGELGVEEAVANPLTGRVLVRYLPGRVQASVEVLIRRALAYAPTIELVVYRDAASKPFSLPKRVLTAELGCSFLKLLLFGGAACPIGGVWCAAGAIIALLFTVHRSL